MASANIPMVVEPLEEKMDTKNQRDILIKCYQPFEIKSPAEGLLMHDLHQKNPAILGSVQMVNGLFGLGVGILIALTNATEFLFTILRIAILSGPFFFFTGLTSNLLYKHPSLLPVSDFLNRVGMAVAIMEMIIIFIDLVNNWSQLAHRNQLKVELLELCAMGVNLCLSLVLCVWIHSENRSQLQRSLQ